MTARFAPRIFEIHGLSATLAFEQSHARTPSLVENERGIWGSGGAG
jgi:hypothetical protein